jgi:hypothetical protein
MIIVPFDKVYKAEIICTPLDESGALGGILIIMRVDR